MTNLGFAQFVPPAPEQEYRPASHIQCKYCDKPIFVGDKSVFLHHGEVGRGKKSGQPVVVDSEHSSGEAVVHELCAIAYLTTSVVDSVDEVESVIDTITADIFGVPYSELLNGEVYCAACEAKIDGDED